MEEPLTTYFMERELHPTSLTTLKRGMGPILPLTSWNGSSHPTRLTTLKRGMSLLGPFYRIILPHLVSYLQIPRDRCFFQKNWPLYNRTLEIFSLWNFCFSSLNFVTAGRGEFSAVRFGWTNRYQPISSTPYDLFHRRSSTVHVLDASIFYYPLTPRRDCF